MFMNFLNRNKSLIVVNTLDLCQGLITRVRKSEQSILDFFIVNEKMRQYLKKMTIDEDSDYCLSNFSQFNKNKRVIESDHNSEILDLDIEFSLKKPERQEMFNLKNTACQEAFRLETENNPKLLEMFENELPFETLCNMWLKHFNSILHKCFKKVRIVNSNKKDMGGNKNLFVERINLLKKIKSAKLDGKQKNEAENRVREIEEEIGEEVSEENMKTLKETLQLMGGDSDSVNGKDRKQIWNLLKTKYPKILPAVPTGKKDHKGNIVTNHSGLKKLYLQTYEHRLRNRPIRKDFEEIMQLRNDLFSTRLKLSQNKKLYLGK